MQNPQLARIHSFLTEIQEIEYASLQLIIGAIKISCCNAAS